MTTTKPIQSKLNLRAMQDLPEYIHREEKEDDLSNRIAEHKKQTAK